MAVWDKQEVRRLFQIITGADLNDTLTLSSLLNNGPAEACRLILQLGGDTNVKTSIPAGSMVGESVCEKKPTSEDVKAIFSILLHRDVSEQDLSGIVADTSTLGTLIHNVAHSREAERRIVMDVSLRDIAIPPPGKDREPCDIMLFGAYGNGNLGDHDQASAIRKMLLQAGIAAQRISASSWEHVAGFDFPGRRYAWPAITNFDLLASLKLLIIGGGGLLGVPHFPLYDKRWVDGIVELGIPYAFFSIGADEEQVRYAPFAAAYEKLISNAAFVSGRDERSVSALRSIRPDTVLTFDPLLFPAIQDFGDGRAHNNTGRRRRIDVIIRSPLSESDRAFLEGFREIYLASTREDIGAIFIEPRLAEERAVMAAFPDHMVCTNMEELREALSTTKWGASMRLHGSIAFVQAKIPFVGFSQPKIRQMMELFGLQGQYCNDPQKGLLDRIRKRDGSGLSIATPSPELRAQARTGANLFTEFVKATQR